MDTTMLLMQVAGFLTMIANGSVPVPAHAKREAEELLEKIGAVLKADAAEPAQERP